MKKDELYLLNRGDRRGEMLTGGLIGDKANTVVGGPEIRRLVRQRDSGPGESQSGCAGKAVIF